MSNAIERGLDILFKNYGVSAENVDVKKSGEYLYACFDELTETFVLPFIAKDDKSAKRTIYDTMRSGIPTENLLFRFQKTYSLWRICDMSYKNVGKNCIQAICKLDVLFADFSEKDMAHIKQKNLASIESLDDKPLELPIKEEVSNVN